MGLPEIDDATKRIVLVFEMLTTLQGMHPDCVLPVPVLAAWESLIQETLDDMETLPEFQRTCAVGLIKLGDVVGSYASNEQRALMFLNHCLFSSSYGRTIAAWWTVKATKLMDAIVHWITTDKDKFKFVPYAEACCEYEDRDTK